nr:MAG TPA: tail assembly chaperone protein [Caudoviricetes sp.]
MDENRLPYETLKIGDTEYKLKISASSAIEIEKKTGKSLVAGMADFDKIETVTLYLWGALNRFQANVDIRKAQEIYDDYIDAGGDLSDMAEILFKTLTVSGFFKRQQAEKLLALAEKAESGAVQENEHCRLCAYGTAYNFHTSGIAGCG